MSENEYSDELEVEENGSVRRLVEYDTEDSDSDKEELEILELDDVEDGKFFFFISYPVIKRMSLKSLRVL